MKLLKYLPLVLALTVNEVDAQWYNPVDWFSNKENKKGLQLKQKDKTKLLPIEWKGNINPVSDSWANPIALGSSTLNVRGSFYGDLKSVKGKDTLEAYIEHADKEKVIKAFENSNPLLKSKLLRKELNKCTDLDRRYGFVFDIFRDGKVVSEEELGILNALPDAIYSYTFFYKSKDQKASLPGVFIIHKYGDNFVFKNTLNYDSRDIEFLNKIIREAEGRKKNIDTSSLEKDSLNLENKLNFSAEQLDSVVAEDMNKTYGDSLDSQENYDGLNDTRTIPQELGTINQGVEEIYNKVDSLNQSLNEHNQKLKSYFDSLNTNVNSLRKKDTMKIKEKWLIPVPQEGCKVDLDEDSWDFGVGYDFNEVNLFSGSVRYNLDHEWFIGLGAGYGEKRSRSPTQVENSTINPHGINWMGREIKNIKEYNQAGMSEFEFGYNEGLISFTTSVGAEFKRLRLSEDVQTYIKDNQGRIKVHDAYNRQKRNNKVDPRFSLGVDVNLGDFKIGGRYVLSDESFGGIRLFYNIR